MSRNPVYRRNMDDAPRPVAAMARAWNDGDEIPLHIHRRGQLIHAVRGVMRIETADAAWIVPPALALWMPPQYPHSMSMRGRLEMRTVYIAPAECENLPKQPILTEVGGLMRELILAALEEPLDYDDDARGGRIAQMILVELGRLQQRRLDVPMPRDERAARVAHALLMEPQIDLGLDGWAERAGASRRTLARLFRAQTGFSFAEWRARLRAIDGLARLSAGQPVGPTAASVGYASASAFSAMVRRNFGLPPSRLVARDVSRN
ncbi:MAG: helix-turn-helix transcriptional regulator [Pseudorhodoplanes sp.]|nr:HTH-type transcriptional regulator NimR [Pseudorhodoplanes sp.]MBW7948712.1 helix-turn-helix transcriptional regulator [Pseudorhodoplanes sp.]GIK81882.1 MAG: AraC family transcriptional regulator [Alphaproteobacteria bacterium]